MKKRSMSYKILLIAAITLMTVLAFVFIITLDNSDDDNKDRESLQSPSPDPDHSGIPPDGSETGSGTETDPGIGAFPDHDLPADVFKPADRVFLIEINKEHPGLTDDLDEEAEAHSSAAVSLVVYDGIEGLYYTYHYGHADIVGQRLVNNDTKFRIASLSKLVVVIVAMRLADEGLLDINEDISGYLGYNVRHPDYPDVPITSRMLMQHTSSIYDSQAFLDSIYGSARASTQSLLSGTASYWGVRPGTAFEYSNFGYTILAAVCELISGTKLDLLAQDILFKPLDIDASFMAVNIADRDNIAILYSSGFAISRSVADQLDNSRSGNLGEDQHLAQGSLVISAVDYAKILAMLGNGGLFRNVRILSPEAVVEIHRADFNAPGFKQGLSTRFTEGGEIGTLDIQDILDNDSAARNNAVLWQYIKTDGSFVPSNGFYWHTGSAFGVFAQYIYMAGTGTAEGTGDTYSSRGIVVITTGANTTRSSTGMLNVCTHLSEIAWKGLGFDTQN